MVTTALRLRFDPGATYVRRSHGSCTAVDLNHSRVAVAISRAGGRHNMPRPLQVDLWPFDLESGVRVTCDVGYLCVNFSLPRGLSVLALGPMYATGRQTLDRQTSDAHHRLMPPTLGAGHNNWIRNYPPSRTALHFRVLTWKKSCLLESICLFFHFHWKLHIKMCKIAGQLWASIRISLLRCWRTQQLEIHFGEFNDIFVPSEEQSYPHPVFDY